MPGKSTPKTGPTFWAERMRAGGIRNRISIRAGTGASWCCSSRKNISTGPGFRTGSSRTGKAITYGVTLIKNAPNSAGAVEFLDYLLDPEGGLKVLEEMGQPPFVPCRVPSEKMKITLPATLRSRVETRQ